jgi:outer membrane immunogenic protein
MEKTLYLGASMLAVAVASILPASAADMYRSEGPGSYEGSGSYKDGMMPAPAWAGFYVGVNAGYGWSAGSDQFSGATKFGGQVEGLNPKGAFGGGQIGYNWQMSGSRWVLGAEADIQASGISETFIVLGEVVHTSSLDWFGTVRGRIGYAFGSSLLYSTGGLAFGRINDDAFGEFKKNETVAGYVLGGGYEYKFSPAWSLKAEYQYINLGKNDPTRESDGRTLSSFGENRLNDDAFHTVRVGLNYHLLPGDEGSSDYKDGIMPAPAWAGFYIGVNGGYGWSAGSDQFSFHDTDTGETSEGLNPKGAFGGGQIGYNWQMSGSRWVLGAEADIQASGISETFNFGEGAVQKSSLDWFGTVRGRIGYALGSSLLYTTGGLAYGRINDNAFGEFKKNETVTGYVLGGGYEYKFSPAWSLKAEYQYINLGKNDPTIESDGRTLSSFGVFKLNDDSFHTVRAGLNYHLLPAYEPLK